MPIDYEEMHGSPTEAYDSVNGWTATRQLLVDWDFRADLVAEILGDSYTGFDSAPDNMFAINASITPFLARQDGVDDQAAYEKAIVSVNYGRGTQRGPDPIQNNYFEDFIPSVEFLTVNTTAKFWKYVAADDTKNVPLAANVSIGKIFAGGDYILKRYGLTAYPTAKLPLIGKVNESLLATKTSFLGGYDFPAQTLLFMPPTMEYVLQIDGTYLINATYRFNYKPAPSSTVGGVTLAGHNVFWFDGSVDPAHSEAWLPILKPSGANGTAIPIYEITDFGTF